MDRTHNLTRTIFLFAVTLALIAGTPVVADTVNWIAGSGNYGVGTNWDAAAVPCIETRPVTENAIVPGTGVTVTQDVSLCSVDVLTLGDSSTFSLLAGTVFNATTADIAATVSGSGALSVSSTAFTGPEAYVFGTSGANIELLNATNSATDTRFSAASSATMTIQADTITSTGAANFNTIIASAIGSGALLQLSAATTLDGSFNSSNGATQTHSVVAEDGGTVNLSGLTSVTGPVDDEDRLLFSVSDASVLNLDGLQTVTAGGRVQFEAKAGSTLSLPALQNTLGAQFFALDPDSQILANGSAWTLSSIGLPNTAATLIQASSSGALLDFSAMMSLDAGFNSSNQANQTHSVIAENGGSVNLSGLISVIGPADDEDRLTFSVSDSGTLNLNGLQSVTAGGLVRFEANSGATLELPSLQSALDAQFVAAGAGSQILATVSGWTLSSIGLPNSNVTLASAVDPGALVDLSGMTLLDTEFNSSNGATQTHTIVADNGGHVDLSALTAITGPVDDEDRLVMSVIHSGTINLDGLETVTAGGAVQFDVRAGATLSLPSLQSALDAQFFATEPNSQILGNASSWTWSSIGLPNSNAVLAEARTSGALLDLSGVSLLNAGFDSSNGSTQTHTIVADDGGTIDLSGLIDITGPADDEDRLLITATGTGNVILDGVQSVNAGGRVQFEPTLGGTLSLPSLQSVLGARFIATDPDSQILAGTSQWSYASIGLPNSTVTLIGAVDPGAYVDVSGMTSLNAGFNSSNGSTQIHSIVAGNGGTVDLRGLDSLVAPADAEDRISFLPSDGGTIIMSPLDSVSGSGRALVALSADGILEFPLSMNADEDIEILAVADSRVRVTDSLSFDHTDETQFNLEAARVSVSGAGLVDIEIGGSNEGIAPVTSPNFGFGQLIIGSSEAPATARLIDIVDNGNGDTCGVAGVDREALYLYGYDVGLDADGLRILNGSTLTLGGFDVYTSIGGVLMHLNPMLTPGVPFPFDEGFVELGTPFDIDEDGVADSVDNCVLAPNPDQTDADSDGFGNACDGDLNGDLFVNNLDLFDFSTAFLSTPGAPNWNPAADFDDNGAVNFLDFVIMTQMFLQPPGPSCPAPAPAPAQNHPVTDTYSEEPGELFRKLLDSR